MAKPIRKTPTLNSMESQDFIKNMHSVENRRINKIEKYFVDIIRANKK